MNFITKAFDEVGTMSKEAWDSLLDKVKDKVDGVVKSAPVYSTPTINHTRQPTSTFLLEEQKRRKFTNSPKLLWNIREKDFPVDITITENPHNFSKTIVIRMVYKNKRATLSMEYSDGEVDYHSTINQVLQEMKEKLIASTPSGLEIENED
jgi:hypothetical protein